MPELGSSFDGTIRVVSLALLTLVLAVPVQGQKQSPEQMAAVGGVTYRSYCANCHGAKAKGDGPVAQYLRVEPTDLTLLAENNEGKFPADRVVASIDGREEVRTHGSREMPIWGDALLRPGPHPEAKVQQKIEALVAYLRSLQK